MDGKIVKAIIIIAAIVSISGFLGYIYYADASAVSSVEVTVSDADLTGLKLASFNLRLHVNMYNPTDQYISELSSKFNIYIDGNYVGEGSFSKVSIPAHSSSEKDVPLTIYYSGLANATVDIIKNVIAEGTFDLTASGRASGNVLFGLIEVSHGFEATYIYP